MPEENAAPEKQATEVETIEVDALSELLKKSFRIHSDREQEKIQSAVKTLVQNALEHTDTGLISENVIRTIDSFVAEIDRNLSEQINQILHHPDFQALEGTWRGLKHLVSNTETDETLKIRVLNVSKEEVRRTLKKFEGAAWDNSPLFKKIYDEEYGVFGGEPFGAICADYYFDHTAPDVKILNGMAQIAAAAHAPFISGTSPRLFGMDSWQELSNPRDLTKIFQTPDYGPWRSLRKSDDSKYVGLTLPRFLSRIPYGTTTNPVDDFDFQEDTGSGDQDKYTWSNACYAMAANITRSFKEYGWCSCIRGVENGGRVGGLPCHTFLSDDGGVDMKCPTEIAISQRREAELSKNGILSFLHWKNTDFAVFIGGQSLT